MLPSREDCLKLHNECNELFYKQDVEIEGYTVEMYNYRFAKDEDFEKHNAYEVRGITFVYDKEIDTWTRHLALNKFFNLGQCRNWYYEDIKHKKVQRVQNKADGSLITFVKFPNGKIRAKSKMSFDSEQAVAAQRIFEENSSINYFVSTLLSADKFPIFEYVSPSNQIVLEYANTELLLLQIRNNDGSYYSSNDFVANADDYNIKTTEELEVQSLEYYIEQKELITGIEGWVITLDDNQMIKIKTTDYFNKHGVMTELREDMIITLVLNETIDDVISVCTGEKRVFIEDAVNKIQNKLADLSLEYFDLRNKYFNVYKENRKEFAIDNKHFRMFPFVMRTINTYFRGVHDACKKSVIDYSTSFTHNLSKARDFVHK